MPPPTEMALSIQDYETIDELGSGVYGIVYRARHRQTGQIVAVKRVQRSRLSSDKLVSNLRNEISIMQHIKHPNIVELYGIFETKNDICMVMELCEGGEIQTLMRRKKRFPEDLAQFYMFQLANALDFLAQNNLIHRDLKPSNILLATRDERSILKLADFGYARVLDEADLASTSCGTPLYMAPEVFNNQPYDGKADLWSVGCILYEMVCGQVPFMAQNQVQLFQLIKASPGVSFPPGVQLSAACRDLIERLLRKDPLHRMTLSQFYWNAFVRAGEDAVQQVIRAGGPAAAQPALLRPRSSSASSSPLRPRTSPFKQIPAAAAAAATAATPPLPTDAPVFPSPQQLPLQSEAPAPSSSSSAAASSSADEFVMIDKTQLQNFATADVITDGRTAALGRLAPPSRPAPVAPATVRATATATATAMTSAAMAAPASGSPPSATTSSASSALSSSPPSAPRSSAMPTSTAVVSASPPSVWSTSPTSLLKGAMMVASEKLGLTTPLVDATARSVIADLLPPVREDVFVSRDERAQFEEIDQASRVAMVVCRFAEEMEATSRQDAYTLYCYALTLFTVAFRRARAFWEQHPQQTATLQGIVGFLEQSYRNCLERAERLQVDLQRSYTSVGGPARAPRIFELLLDRAKQLAYDGAIDEMVTGPPNYRAALQLLEAILITNDLGLTNDHRELTQSYIERIKQRLATLQKRHSITAAEPFKRFSPPEAL